MAKKKKEFRKLVSFKMDTHGKIEISWMEPNNEAGCDDILSIMSVEEPVVKLSEQYYGLAEVARKMAELPEDFNLTTRGLILKHKNDKRWFTLLVMRVLDYDNTPLNIKTPTKPEAADDTFGALDKESIKQIDEFISLVWEYIDGHKLQPDMFKGETND